MKEKLTIAPDDTGRRIYDSVSEFTGTGPIRTCATVGAVRYVVEQGIPGDLVECGVWRGGSVMAMALTLLETGAKRKIWLYDSFEGMTVPKKFNGHKARLAWEAHKGEPWCYCPMKEVIKNVNSTGYPSDLFHFVKGRVEDTLPDQMPKSIALLRLDMDWHSPTEHALIHLFPLLSPGGILYLDDYGKWLGVRKALNWYTAMHGIDLSLIRVDRSGRIAIK